MHMPTKKYLRKKANKLCLMGQIVIESHSLWNIDRTHVASHIYRETPKRD